MKKIVIVTLILTSTLGYSQKRETKDILIDYFEDADRLRTKRNIHCDNCEHNNTLINQINSIEFNYLNSRARELQYRFANQDLSKYKKKLKKKF